eukprot:11202481-Lingulodinium_polyedra.AAC.1
MRSTWNVMPRVPPHQDTMYLHGCRARLSASFARQRKLPRDRPVGPGGPRRGRVPPPSWF